MASAEIEAVRDWVGSEPDDAAIGGALARSGGDPDRAALSILRRRRNDMLTDPVDYSVAGDHSRSYAENLARLDRLIGRLAVLCGDDADGSTVTVGRLVRPTPGR